MRPDTMAVAVREYPGYQTEDAVSRDTLDLPGPFTRESYVPQKRALDNKSDGHDTSDEEGTASHELAAIMTAASTPVTPGPSSPPLDTPRSSDFVPPTRPSSTPFPNAQQGQTDIRCLTCQPDGLDDSNLLPSDHEHEHEHLLHPAAEDTPSPSAISQLPAEIHECILDHLFGYRVSTTSPSSLSIPSVNARSWNTALRHSRRKELSNLALVTPLWRDLIQERLFRHIKVKATISAVHDVMLFFVQRKHLSTYVKHIEIWFPVFQPNFHASAFEDGSLSLPTVSPEGIASATYGLPTDNAAMDEIFHLVNQTFACVRVMTLEGGERKKAPRVRFNAPIPLNENGDLPKIPSIRTLIVKGQWNIIRQPRDWETISKALPNLEEWHGTYAKPKSKSYLSMANTLDILDRKITKLNLCLESDYRREITCPPYYLKVCEQVHWCEKLARAANRLEHLSYTGRVCHCFFDMLAKCTDPRTTRLKTIDVTVKNCCRKDAQWNESGSGITDIHFIKAFAQLVLSGIRALEHLKMVQLLRIRYVDLDSPSPPLNPFFMVRDGWCSGVWNEEIIEEIHRVRPDLRFEGVVDNWDDHYDHSMGGMNRAFNPALPKSRILSLKLTNYERLAPGSLSPGMTML
ncbi:hypothetical protein GGR57DRAFT_386415 [Xylariaceae sp. FL1272]|nr:hypothetical protein GGR57DRAFT_386415 [Xylariaceae sp. FL1272]